MASLTPEDEDEDEAEIDVPAVTDPTDDDEEGDDCALLESFRDSEREREEGTSEEEGSKEKEREGEGEEYDNDSDIDEDEEGSKKDRSLCDDDLLLFLGTKDEEGESKSSKDSANDPSRSPYEPKSENASYSGWGDCPNASSSVSIAV